MSLNDYLNKVYFFGATIGVRFIGSIAAKKLFKMNLGLPVSIEPAAKMSVVLGACALGVDYAQEKKWIPKEPFKEASKS